MLATLRPNVNRKEAAMILALVQYTILALEEQIEKTEHESNSDMEYMSGLYAKVDEAKKRARYFRDLLN